RAVREWIVRAAEAPFDLERAPLLRAHLLRLGAGDHVLAFVLHHILADGASLDLFVREIAAQYGASVDLPALPVQYADYAAWQSDRMPGEPLRLEAEHWTRQLDGAPRIPDLPPDRPRPAEQTYGASAHAFTLGESLATSLRAASREHGVTPAMLCLAAF